MFKRLGLGAVAAAMLAFAAPARADLVTVVEIDLTAYGTGVAPSFEFPIPGFAAPLHMDGGWIVLDQILPIFVPAQVTKSSVGSGVLSPIDLSPEIDNLSGQEFINFSIPGAPGFEFTLVGVEFSYVDPAWRFCFILCGPWNEGNDDFAVLVDATLPPVVENPIAGPTFDPQNGSSCAGSGEPGIIPPGGDGSNRCRVGLADGLEAYLANNPGEIDAFDYYMNVDPSLLFGSLFTFTGALGGFNDDFKITKVYWEVSAQQTDVPEPATLSLLGLGLVGLGLAARRRRAAA